MFWHRGFKQYYLCRTDNGMACISNYPSIALIAKESNATITQPQNPIKSVGDTQ